MAVGGDGGVDVTTNLTLSSVGVTGHATLNTVNSELAITNRLYAIGATMANASVTNQLTANQVTVNNQLSAPTLVVQDLAITNSLVLPTTIAQPIGTTVICAPQILAGTTYNVPFLSGYALDVSGDAIVSRGMTVSTLTVLDTLTLPTDVAVDNLTITDLFCTTGQIGTLTAGSAIVTAATIGALTTPNANINALNIVDQMTFDPSANVVIPTSYHTALLSNQIVAGTTNAAELNFQYAMDVVGGMRVTAGMTVGGVLVGSGGLSTTAGAFSDSIASAKGIAGVTANFSGAVTVGQGITVGGLLVGSRGITTSTGYFSSGLTTVSALSTNTIQQFSGSAVTISANGGTSVFDLPNTPLSNSSPTGRLLNSAVIGRTYLGVNATTDGTSWITVNSANSGMYLRTPDSTASSTKMELALIKPASTSVTPFLIFDSSNNRMGILNSSPASTLDVTGTAQVSGLLTATSGVATNTIRQSSGTAVTISANAGASVFEAGDAILTNTTPNGRLTTYQVVATNYVGTNAAYNSTTGWNVVNPSFAGMFLRSPDSTATGPSTKTELALVKPNVAGSQSFLIFDTSNNRMGILNASPATTLDVNGTAQVSGLLTATSGVATNTIQPSSGSSLNILPAGGAVTIGNQSAMTTQIVFQQNTTTNGYMTMNRGGFVQGLFGFQFGPTTGTINTPAGGTGAVIGWNSVTPGNNDFELILGRGNNANGGSFRIYGTSGAGQQTPTNQLLRLDQQGNLSVPGTITAATGGGNTVPVGSITMYIATTAPTGWLVCDGSPYSTTGTYAALFALIGTTYGSNGAGTFRVPDLRSRVPVGYGQGTGLTNRNLADASGAETVALDMTQMPPHNHNVRDLGHAHAYIECNEGGGGYAAANGDNGTNRFLNRYAASTTTAVAAIAQDSVGGGLPHNNMQPFLVVNYIIKF